MSLKPCLNCGQATPGSRCPACRRAAINRQGRPNRQARGYDTHYDQRRRALRARAKANRTPCQLCGRAIQWDEAPPHPESFSAHHTTRDKAGPLVAAHLFCNIRAGQPNR